MSYTDHHDKGACYERNVHRCPECGSGDTGTRVRPGDGGRYPTQYECSACGATFDVKAPHAALAAAEGE